MAHTIRGTVVSTAMAKTITIRVEHKLRHPRYDKVVSYSNKIKAHNEIPDIKIGDLVEIAACRPLSKSKHFRVIQKLSP